MKEIKAIIQPFMLDDVLHALEQIEGLPGLTLSEVRGWGQSRARNASDVVAVGDRRFAKKTKLEIVAPDSIAEKIAGAIAGAAHTGNPGDGKIFVYDVEESIRIRTGEPEHQATDQR